MAYCTYVEVRLIINTEMADADITKLIVLADAEIDARELNSRGSNIKKLISMHLTASMISTHDPTSASLGPMSVGAPVPAKDWRVVAEALIKRSGGPPIVVANDPLPNE